MHLPLVSETFDHFYFYDSFGKSGPIFKNFALLNSERIYEVSLN